MAAGRLEGIQRRASPVTAARGPRTSALNAKVTGCGEAAVRVVCGEHLEDMRTILGKRTESVRVLDVGTGRILNKGRRVERRNRGEIEIVVPFEAGPGVAHVGRQPIRKLSANRRGHGTIRPPRVGGSARLERGAREVRCRVGAAVRRRAVYPRGHVFDEVMRRPRQKKYVETISTTEGRRVSD